MHDACRMRDCRQLVLGKPLIQHLPVERRSVSRAPATRVRPCMNLPVYIFSREELLDRCSRRFIFGTDLDFDFDGCCQQAAARAL